MDPLSLLHDVSPYEGFDPSPYPPDLQGWGSEDPIFNELISAIRPELIIEVGTWKGASAINMARIADQLGLPTKIVCVDTWLGSPEHFLAQEPSWRASLLMQNGFPRLYFTFLANVIRSGFTDRIIPLPSTSENAVVILQAKGLRPDLVYVDAAHEEEPALRDYHAYWKILSDRGALLGDDYVSWEGVTRAANRFSREVGQPIVGKFGKFVVSRSPTLQPQITFAR